MLTRTRSLLVLSLLLLVVTGVYSNHFENSFHFDDSHTVENNVYIRSIRNIPRFFSDPSTFSSLASHREYRPLLMASLSIDYYLAGGLKPFFFHLTSFICFLAQLVLMFFFFKEIMKCARPQNSAWPALFATAWYGLHPVSAETVNYIIQRGDLGSTLCVVAGMVVYISAPALRKYGLYLIPPALGALVKPSAVMFPAILLCYILLFEESGTFEFWKRGKERTAFFRSFLRSLPAFAAAGALFVLHHFMTLGNTSRGFIPARQYIITQAWIAFRYVRSLVLPVNLSADADLQPLKSAFDDRALAGIMLLTLMTVWAIRASRRRETIPAAFGLAWFFIAMAPTSLVPLAEVTNDHRMFFPFVGLTAAFVWQGFLMVEKVRPTNKTIAILLCAAAIAALPVYARGTYLRNQVWRTEESLWLDVTVKSPQNGRGLMNYGLTQMAKGSYARALDYFQRALEFCPNYSTLQINLGIVKNALGRSSEVQNHFLKALAMDPRSSVPRFYYGRWLLQQGRKAEAAAQLQSALQVNPNDFQARHLLMDFYSGEGQWENLRALAEDTLSRAPSDSRAAEWKRLAGLQGRT